MSLTLMLSEKTTVLAANYFPAIDLSDGDYEFGLAIFETYHTIPNVNESNNEFYFVKDDAEITVPKEYPITLRANCNTMRSQRVERYIFKLFGIRALFEMTDILNIKDEPIFDDRIVKIETHTYNPFTNTTFGYSDEISIPIQQQDLYTDVPANTTAYCLIIHDRVVQYNPLTNVVRKIT
ncbi:hypothetical protein ALC57_12182 [Trachymyrmex cornetzi]|uniref:Uncharacterized protein n=1 Tax=Trachymyrmex cornetzi TaxID=471704 RepID=A0A151J1F1_9HYME|nr:hypothetical protein ALC57_12182 [Trachymyrmex cornetzi]